MVLLRTLISLSKSLGTDTIVRKWLDPHTSLQQGSSSIRAALTVPFVCC